MPKNLPHISKNFIVPLNMNNLRGRMFIAPKTSQKSKTNFLIVYGQKSTLEKWSSLANELRQYGNVIMPDLPGFGGMESFYKIKEAPTLDNFADYLASFIKLKFRSKPFVIVGLSFGFVVATRMLQKYPELSNKVIIIINISGFINKYDLKISKLKRVELLTYTKIFSYSFSSNFYRAIAYDKRIFLKIKNNSRNEDKELLKQNKMVLKLLKKNDTRTHMYTLNQLFKLDNTHKKIELPVWSLIGNYDEYLKQENVKKNLESVYLKYHEIKLKSSGHSLNYSNLNEEDITNLIPYKLKVLLNRQNRKQS